MKVVSTKDVDAKELKIYIDKLQNDLEVEVSTGQAGFKSADPPSWIILLADSNWWIRGLGFYAALYIAKVVEDAASRTLPALSSIAKRLKTPEDDKFTKFAGDLSELKTQLPNKTKLEIGLPFPNDFFATRLTLNGTDATDIAIEIGFFLHHLPSFDDLVKSEGLTEDNVATAIFLSLKPDGSLEVSWFDSESLQKEVRILPLIKD